MNQKIKSYFRRLDIRSIFYSIILILLVVQLCFAVYHFKKIGQIQNKLEQTYEKDFMIAKFASHANLTFFKINHFFFLSLESDSQEKFDEFFDIVTDAKEEFLEDLKVVQNRSEGDPELGSLVYEVEVAFQNYMKQVNRFYKKKLINLSLTPKWIKSEEREIVFELLEEIVDTTAEKGFVGQMTTKSQLKEFRVVYVIGSIIILIIFGLLVMAINALMVKPIHSLRETFHVISSGNFKEKVVPAQFYSDVYKLATTFTILQKNFLEAIAREESAKKALSEFLANMSHELRTPLNAVIGFSTIAIDDFQKGELSDDSVDNFQQIRKSGEHLLSLVNDILDLSKINSGEFKIVPRPISLKETIDDSLVILKQKAQEKGLTLSLESENENVFINGDPIRIKQIIINLINNAIKFTRVGGVFISVKTKKIDDGFCNVKIVIRDTGIGIPKEKQKQIFENFKQATDDTAVDFGGTGLGLSISKNLVQRMGGRIWVESEEGKGSSFSFNLKLKESNESEFQETEKALKKYQNTSLDTSWKILIVEDYPSNFQIAKHFLTKLGFTCVSHAEDGKSAIEIIQKEKFNLLLIDMFLPDMNGPEISKKILQILGDKCPPMAAFTANDSDKDRETCLKAGMKYYITKPIKRESIATLLTKVQAKEKYKKS